MNYKTPAAEWRKSLTALLIGLMLFGQTFAQAVAPAPSSPAPALSGAEKEIADKITIGSIKDATAALSSREMEGRGTMQPGGEKAANWIADRFKQLGLKPLGDKGSYLQKIDFKETVVTPESGFTVGGQSLVHGTDFAFVPMNNGNKNVGGDVVFVSYAIQSKQAGIDMLEGVNLSGKVV